MARMKSFAPVLAALLFASVAAAQQVPYNQPTIWASKPDVPAFERLENDRMEAAQKSIDQLVAVKGPRTIENTLAPYDEAARQLNAGSDLAQVVEQTNPEAAYRDKGTEMLNKVSAAQTALSLNQEVYKALSALDMSKADAASRYYVQRQLLEFKLAGVDKDDATREKLKKLNEQLTDDQSKFERNIADDVRTIELKDASELAGLPQDYIDAHKPGPDGKIKITTSYPDIFPVLNYAASDDLRHRVWAAFTERAYPKNTDILEDMMKMRYQIATLVGYSSWADYNAADKMALKGQNVENFIDQLSSAARPTMQREYDMLLAEKRKTDPKATDIWEYEHRYLSERLRRSDYAFDSQSIRPYLPYNEVKQGVLDTAAALFHITFRQEHDVPAWDPSVETWEVIDGGKMIGRFYLDMHPRAGKYTHDETAPLLDGIAGKQMPEAALICNLPTPTATDPGLMDYDDVVTFFHEFGHLMHHILGGQQKWAGISGISMEMDFVEAPSQMLEEWMHSPQVLAKFAKNYKTGEPIPASLVQKMNRASAFGRAGDVSQQVMFASISYNMYKRNPEDTDPSAVCLNAFHRFSLLKSIPESGHFFASFDHLAGYSSAYYTYMWDLVIAEDFFQQFDQENLLAGDTPMRYRRTVLEPGGSVSANDLVKSFLGRPQNMEALKKWMNVEFSTPASGGGTKAVAH
ncbi:MAG TPA: M3 family metallopeptidase [Candidatus Acidoferrum sp.]|jgi:thimet oligopeptidase|nr:M3 family metallopeptidase [Candidatus Acidoferrum sp.]